MTFDERERLRARFEDLSLDQLRAIVEDDADDYTPEAVELANKALRERQLDPAWAPPGERVRCPACGHVGGLVIERVFLPSEAPDGVTTFEARSCRGCGLTTLIRVDV